MANKSRKRAAGGFGMNLTGPGSVFTMAFIALAIGMGLLLSRGLTPRSVLSDPGETGDLEIVQDTPAPNQEGLQLKTIHFKECASKVAVGLLVDRSGSMRGQKIVSLKDALTTFTTGLGNQSVIGLDSFSSITRDGPEVSEDVPFSKYQDVKPQVARAIQNLYPNGNTHTRAAFTFMKDKLLAAQTKFPDQSFALIFLSDGIPEVSPPDCTSGRQTIDPLFGPRCFANPQDPTQDPNIAKEIQDANIKVYSIAIYNKNDPSDIYFLPDMRNMMTKIASSQTNYYETPDPTQLKQIYKDIATKICNDII